MYAGSRFTQPAESRYSPTEGEALAASWSLQHSKIFTLGCNDLLLSVDHKPLLGLFNNRNISSMDNPRLINLKESILAWYFTITYSPGKWHRGPDALSRNPGNLYFDIFENQANEFDKQALENIDNQILTVQALTLNNMILIL